MDVAGVAVAVLAGARRLSERQKRPQKQNARCAHSLSRLEQPPILSPKKSIAASVQQKFGSRCLRKSLLVLNSRNS